MHRSKLSIVSRAAFAAVFISLGQGAMAQDSARAKEEKALMDFQCHAAKTVQKLEANYADMARRFTDAHPVMQCMKAKMDELKAGGK